MPAPLSLKGRALALLAQREQSPLELKRKLLRHAIDAIQRMSVSASASASAVSMRASNVPEVSASSVEPRAVDADVDADADADVEDQREQAQALVDDVIVWLQANGHLSERRFVESRVHARASRYGNQRIRQELSQHGVALTTEDAADLKQSELARAQEVWQRKYGEPAADATGRARQARFLIGRGFTGEIVRQVVLGTRSNKPPRD